MKVVFWLAIGLAGFCSAGAGAAAEADPAAAEFRAVLEQWIQTRQLISKAKSEWAAEREMLQQTLAMLQREVESLETALSQTETQSVAVTAERALVKRQQESYDAALTLLRDRLAALVPRLQRLQPSFPEPLQKAVSPLWDRLAAGGQGATQSAGARLQTVVTLLNEAEKFDQGLTLHAELRPGPDGQPVKVQTLYLGLAQAWYVDQNGRIAGRGVPTSEGWRWVEEPGLGPRVQEAVAVHEGRRPARYVELPVEVQ
ncbi:MAG: DUF3450 domain-containing protein [Limisphaera sp.]|nr:DUF3450 domain-containing protein [Limisphaera sp.]